MVCEKTHVFVHAQYLLARFDSVNRIECGDIEVCYETNKESVSCKAD